MSRKIRLTGLFIMAVILLAGLIAICGVSSQNIGPVKSPVVVGTSDNSAKLSWKRVGSSDGYFVYQKKGDKLLTISGQVLNFHSGKYLSDANFYKKG